MPVVKVNTKFEPAVMKAYKKNETVMSLSLSSSDSAKTYWCECDITVQPPLSLAHDKELNIGRTRIGILKPNGNLEKQIKLYTRPNNFPDNYNFNITTYVYDEDGAIAERWEHDQTIKCEG